MHNMAKLAKEATTVWRVLESLFRYFGTGNLWSLQNGLALVVLLDMQMQMEKSGRKLFSFFLFLLFPSMIFIRRVVTGYFSFILFSCYQAYADIITLII